MAKRLSPHFIELLYDALLKSYWRKKSLRNFLRRSQVTETFLASFSDSESKREWLDRLFPRLEESERGQALLQEMARSLAEQHSFPDLIDWEDSAEKIRDAKAAVVALKEYIQRNDDIKRDEKEVVQRRKEAEKKRVDIAHSQHSFEKLQTRLDELCKEIGTQKAGYDFQDWFYDLMNFFDVDHRRPYTVVGRQIDGSITIDGTTFLVELKFTTGQADATTIDSILKKVNDKADNTMGIMLSMSSYSSVALREASFSKSPLLLLDAAHLYLVLGGSTSFQDLVRRVRRHSSQEGTAYLPVAEFGGA